MKTTKQRATTLDVLGEVTNRYQADALLSGPGSAVIVRRGVLRSLVLPCPDACQDILTVNLDTRAGPAWRLYLRRAQVSLFPSIWRETGCCSHFIVWRSRIFWCDKEGEEVSAIDEALEIKVAAALHTTEFRSYVEIADLLQEVPWAVLAACERLVSIGQADKGHGKGHGTYRRRRLLA